MFNEKSKSRQSIKSLLKQLKQHPVLFARLGDGFVELNDSDHADKILVDGIEDYPNYATGFLVLGESYLYQGQIREAEETVLKGLRQNPNHLGLMHLLEKVKRRMEDFLAVDKIQRCLRMRDPLLDEELAKRDQEDPETMLVWSEILTEMMVRADERVALPLAQREKKLPSLIEEDIKPEIVSESVEEESPSDLELPAVDEVVAEEAPPKEVPDLESRLLSAETDEEISEEAEALADDIIRRVEAAQDNERNTKGQPPSDADEPFDETIDPSIIEAASQAPAMEDPELPSTQEAQEELEEAKQEVPPDESELKPPEEEILPDVEEPFSLEDKEIMLPSEEPAEKLETPETLAAAPDLEPPVEEISAEQPVDELEAEDIAASSDEEEISEVTETDETIISETQELLAELKKTESEDIPEPIEENDISEEEITIRPAKLEDMDLEDEARKEVEEPIDIETPEEESAEVAAWEESAEIETPAEEEIETEEPADAEEKTIAEVIEEPEEEPEDIAPQEAAKPQQRAAFKFLEDIDAFGLPMNMDDKELMQDLGLESEEQSKDRKEPEPQPKEESKPASPPPKNRIATRTLGELYATQQKYDEAIDVYQQLIEKDPENQSYEERLEDLKKRKALSST